VAIAVFAADFTICRAIFAAAAIDYGARAFRYMLLYAMLMRAAR